MIMNRSILKQNPQITTGLERNKSSISGTKSIIRLVRLCLNSAGMLHQSHALIGKRRLL